MQVNRLRVAILLLLALPARGAQAWESGSLRLRGRLMTRFAIKERPQDDNWTSRFQLTHARLDGRFTPYDWATLVLELEGAGWIELDDRFTPDGDLALNHAAALELRDAYGRFRIWKRKIELTAGQFKKPFSRLRLASPWELLLPERGLLDEHVISGTRHGGYGARDVGVMASGRFKKLLRLRYFLGAFSGPRFVDRVEASNYDIVGRIQLGPLPGLKIALDASHKVYHYREGVTLTDRPLRRGGAYTGNLLGADAELTLGDFTVQLEGAVGDNVDLGPGHRLFGLHGSFAYALVLGGELRLTPAVMLEVFDPSNQDDAGAAVRIAGALNLDIGAGVRLTAYAEGTSGDVLAFDPEAADGRGAFVSQRPPIRALLQLGMAF